MEVQLKANGFSGWRKVCSAAIPRELSQELIISDTMPDVGEILFYEASPLIRSKDVSEGSVALEANVPVRVTYLSAQDGSLRVLDLNLSLSAEESCAALTEDCRCTAGLTLKALNARTLNPRKILVEALAEVRLDCYQPCEIAFAAPEEPGDEAVHILAQTQELSAICCVTEKTFVLTDEFILPEGATPAGELLGYSTRLLTEDVKAVGGKMIVRGCAKSRVIYASPEGRPELAEFTTGFSQIVDAACDAEALRPCTELLLSGMYYEIEPGYDGRTIRMELHAVAQLRLYRTEKLRYISDAYSNSYALEAEREQRETECLCGDYRLLQPLRTMIETERSPAEISFCCAELLQAQPDNAHGLRLTLAVILCCRDESGKPFFCRKALSQVIDAGIGAGERLIVSSVPLTDLSALPVSGGVELRMNADINGLLLRSGELSCISALRYDESALSDHRGTPSLVLMKATSEDSLWQIAKENLSSVEAIRAANHLEDAAEPWEKLLLIPKTW